MLHKQVSIGYKACRGPFGRLHRSTDGGRYIPSAGDGWSMSEPEQTGNRQATESAALEPSDLAREAFRYGGA